MTAVPTGTARREPIETRLSRVISLLHMSEDKKVWMQERWLDQVRWFDHRAETANRWHAALRVIAIAGGVLVPGLVSLGGSSSSLWGWARPAAFVVSLLVATAVGLESFFHFGERWRHYRRTAELLEIEGWLFIQGGDPYRRHSHDQVFPTFAQKVEDIIRRDVEVFLTQIVREKQADDETEDEAEIQSSSEVNPLDATHRGPSSDAP